MPTTKERTINGVDTQVLGQTVSAVRRDPDLGRSRFRVRNRWIGGNHNCSTVASYYSAKEERTHKHPFDLHADEPPLLAGGDEAANPVEHLLNALAGCMTTSMVAHAAVRGIHIEELESELEGDIDLKGFLGIDPNVPRGFTNIRVRFRVKADVDDIERLKRLTEFSPVFNTLTQGTRVDVQVQPK